MKLDKHLNDILSDYNDKQDIKESEKIDEDDDIISIIDDFEKDAKELMEIDDSMDAEIKKWTDFSIMDVLTTNEVHEFGKASRTLSFPHHPFILYDVIHKLTAGGQANDRDNRQIFTFNSRLAPIRPGDREKKIVMKGNNPVEVEGAPMDELVVDGKKVKIATDSSSYIRQTKQLPPDEMSRLRVSNFGSYDIVNPDAVDYLRIRGESEHTIIPDKDRFDDQGRKIYSAKGIRVHGTGYGYKTLQGSDIGEKGIGIVLNPTHREKLVKKYLDYYNTYVYYKKSDMPDAEKREKLDELLEKFKNDKAVRSFTFKYLAYVPKGTIRDLVYPQKTRAAIKAGSPEAEKLKNDSTKRLKKFESHFESLIEKMAEKGYNIATMKAVLLAITAYSNYIFSSFEEKITKKPTGTQRTWGGAKVFTNTLLLERLVYSLSKTDYAKSEAHGIIENIKGVQDRVIETLQKVFGDTVDKSTIENYPFVKKLDAANFADLNDISTLQPIFDLIREGKHKGLKEMAVTKNEFERSGRFRAIYHGARRLLMRYYRPYLGVGSKLRFYQLEGVPMKASELDTDVIDYIVNIDEKDKSSIAKTMLDMNQKDLFMGRSKTYETDTAGVEFIHIEKLSGKITQLGKAFAWDRETYAGKREPTNTVYMPISIIGTGGWGGAKILVPGIFEHWYIRGEISKPFSSMDTSFPLLFAEYKPFLEKHAHGASSAEAGMQSFIEKLKNDKVIQSIGIEGLAEVKTEDDIDPILKKEESEEKIHAFLERYEQLQKEYEQEAAKIYYGSKVMKDGETKEDAVKKFHEMTNKLGMEYAAMVARFVNTLFAYLSIEMKDYLKKLKQQKKTGKQLPPEGGMAITAGYENGGKLTAFLDKF